MKTFLSILCLLLIIIGVSAQKANKIWETNPVLDVPESVLFGDSLLYVSCINGNSNEKNGKGYIAKVSLKGEVLQKEWATDINAPKGMGAFNGMLYVTDIDRVHAIDINTGIITQTFEFANAKFLNDISISTNGVVAISDMGDHTIYTIQHNVSQVFISDTLLVKVNGLFWDVDYLLAGTKNNIYKIDKDDKSITNYISNTGGIDGLERVNANFMITSDWSGKVQLVSENTEPKILLNFEDAKYNAADIEFNTSTLILYIPTFLGNSVAAYQLSF